MLDSSIWTPETLQGYTQERTARMARLRFASALMDLLTRFGLPDRADRRRRMGGLLRQRPELGAALSAVHSGPWAEADAAYSPDILTTLALA